MTRRHADFFGFIADWLRFANRSDAAYRTLGVSERASDDDIEQAYLQLMAQYRPERLVGLAEPIRRRTESKASEIDTAYVRIRTLRKREASLEAPPAAPARSDDRGAGSLVWVALALIALVTLAWLAPLRELWAPQAPLSAPQASIQTLPAPSLPAPSAPAPSTPAPSSSAAQPAAPTPVQNRPPVERLVTLMPRDPPPVRAAPPASPALSGKAALVEALRAGQLRPANGDDLSRWAARWSAANRRGVPAVFRERSVQMTAYVIQKDFTIPDGLYGAHSVVFLLDTRVPYPRGNPGHSAILDLSTGSCMGALCGMLLD
jgi:hypothetical protein